MDDIAKIQNMAQCVHKIEIRIVVPTHNGVNTLIKSESRLVNFCLSRKLTNYVDWYMEWAVPDIPETFEKVMILRVYFKDQQNALLCKMTLG